MQDHDLPTQPAKLPVHSRAASAQKLDEHPLSTIRGVYYAAPHHNPNPSGWRMRRHVKRKNLHRTNQQYLAIDRIGTQWTMLPMAFGALIIVVVVASILVALTAAVETTQKAFNKQSRPCPTSCPKTV